MVQIFMRWIWFFPLSLLAIPPRAIPTDLYNEFTFGGLIPVYEWYVDNSYPPDQPIVFQAEQIEEFIQKARMRQESYYGSTDTYLYTLLDRFASYIEGKTIGIIGSTVPWYESIILAYGGRPVTIDYNKIVSEDLRIQVMTVEENERNPQKFDSILSISSIEHDGLGRYGDGINPQADIQTMKKMRELLNEGGLFFLAVPVGRDALFWNAHRVYGKLRLPLILEGWEIVDSAGFSESDLALIDYCGHQPVFVLRDYPQTLSPSSSGPIRDIPLGPLAPMSRWHMVASEQSEISSKRAFESD